MEFEKSRLERLKRSLYSRNESSIPREKRTPVSGREYTVPNDWGDKPSFDLPADIMIKKNNSFFNKFLVIAIIFFVCALGIASFIFFGGLNSVSSNNVDIKVTGPSSISSGEELDFNLDIINQNRTNLEKTTLYIDYPTGAQSIGPSGKIITRDKIDFGTLEKGANKNQDVRVMFFGEKGAVKTIKFRLEYTVTGSNAIFSKEKTYDVSISSSPIILNVSYPKEVNSGQEVDFTIDVTSNSSVVIQNTLLKIEYPYGFTYKDSSIKPLRDNMVWNLGDLKNGDKKTLTISGILVGQNLEDRSFRISLGTPNSPTTQDFDTNLALEQATIGIRKSFFGLTISTGGEQKNIGEIGASVPVSINWQNTLPDRIVNNIIVAKLSGNIFDRSGVSTGDTGFYSSSDGSIVWDKNTVSSLQDISPGDGNKVSFSLLSLLNSVQTRSIKNPYINVHVDMTGNRTGTEATAVSSSQDLTIKFNSVIGLTAKSYRSGVFTNTGPIPPRADSESTYTVAWALTNTSNDLKNTIVSAVLPVNIVWKGDISPSGEHISYNPDSRTVTWSVGNISAGIGFAYLPRTVSFKLGVTPSVTQIGSVLNLLSDTSASANDTFTGTNLRISVGLVNTHFSDSNFRNGDDTVVR